MNKVLVLGGNTPQLPYIKYMHSNGYNVVLCDKNANSVSREFSSEFHAIGYDEVDSLFRLTLELGFTHEDKVFTSTLR